MRFVKLSPISKKSLRLVILLFSIVFCANINTQAQDISVTSFRALDNDLTANTYGTMERDQNGEVAALIKVVTKAQGFLFDGGMTGIVRVKQDVGEVWVYVPHGIKRITIKHPDLGVLRDYYFPLPIEKAKTYEMKLSTGKVETIVTHSVNKQFVSFQVSPANAIVELNDEMLEVDADGHAEKVVSYGKYTYRVSSPDYYTQAGTLNVTADNKVVVKVNLKPNFGWLQLDAKEEFHGAYAYVDNERMGQLPLITKGLKSGKHHLKVVKPLYKTYEQDFEISDNDTLALQVKLDANFARVQLHAPDSECEIFIDGKAVSQGSWSGGLEVGEYLVEVRKASHRSAQEVVTILNHEDRSVQLPKPTPITTFVAISSSPSEAKVFIDGKEMGETPLMLSEVLIGEREIKFVKEGRLDKIIVADLKENIENKVSAKLDTLPEKVKLSIQSQPRGATVSVDGKYVGTTPCHADIRLGEHRFELSKAGYSRFESTENITLDGPRDYQYTLQRLPWSQRRYNKSYTKSAVYASGQLGYEYPLGGLSYSASLGTYLRSINIEASYAMAYDPSLQLQVGYGIPIGKKFVLTPQAGMDMYLGVYCSDFDYTYDEEGFMYEQRRQYQENKLGICAALRMQYCLNKHIALFLRPQYSYFSAEAVKNVDDSILGGISLKAGLVFNLGRE